MGLSHDDLDELMKYYHHSQKLQDTSNMKRWEFSLTGEHQEPHINLQDERLQK
jgi:hypothetical protein